MMVMFGQRLRELEPGPLVGSDDPLHHAGPLEHGEVAIDRTLSEPVVAGDDFRDGQRRPGRRKDLHEPLAVGRIPLAVVAQAAGRDPVEFSTHARTLPEND